MKTKAFLPILAFITLGGLLTSCEKTDNTEPEATEITTTTELAGRQATSDNLTEDANDIYMNAADDNSILGGRPSDANDVLTCGEVTVTPLLGFPKTITIDFKDGCVGRHGVTRSGIITIVVSDSVRKSGSTATMSFTNYIVNGFKMEGTITWTNTSTANTKSWTRVVSNGKTTNTADGKYWFHSGTKTVVQTGGLATPRRFSDDVFSITGTHTVKNAAGLERTTTILDPLIKATECRYVQDGSMKLQGPRHYVVIDFGNGVCDNDATLSVDGGEPFAIKL